MWATLGHRRFGANSEEAKINANGRDGEPWTNVSWLFGSRWRI